MINIKDFDPNIIRTNEKSYKNIFIYYTRYVTIKKGPKNLQRKSFVPYF